MPNILFLTPQLPYPPHQGTTIRNWGLIKHLAKRHAITLLSFVDEGQSAESTELRAACRKIVTVPAPRRSRAARLRTLFSPDPDLARRLWSPDFSRALTALLRESQFDLIHIEGLEMAPYLPLIRDLTATSRPVLRLRPANPSASAQDVGLRSGDVLSLPKGCAAIIYDAHNAEHIIQRRAFTTDLRQPVRWPAALYSWLQIPRLEKFEADICCSVDAVLCVSEEDSAALRKITPELNPVVIANGIDLKEYQLPNPKDQIPRTKDQGQRTKSQGPTAKSAKSQEPNPNHQPPTTNNQQPALVFTGKMDYRPNVDAALWFAEEILPRIRLVKPEAQFFIVGQKPTERLTKLNGQNGVIVTGAVEDTRPFIAESAVYVAPLRMGGGTRFKLLEAMALTRPIVSTTIGAEGFAVRSGQELLLADTPENFADAVVQLLNDSARAAAIGQAGLAFAQAHYDWSAIIPKVERVYEKVMRDT
jgi:polysaccharide biosynthesis protein PslH